MADDGRRIEDIALSREQVLRAVVLEAHSKRELTEVVESSRSTVDRAIRELLDVGLVTQRDGRYEATLAGECALEAVEAFHERMQQVSSARGVLGCLPPDTPLDSAFLDGADVYTTMPEMPDGVIQRLFESIEGACHLRGVAPAVLSGHLKPFYDAAKASDADVEMVLDSDVLDQLIAEPSTRDIFLSQLTDDRITISRGDVPFSFGLWITETEVGVVVYTDTGIRGVIVNDTDTAYSWAERQFEELSADASEITMSGIELDD
ncbi:hypothetical protein GL213_04655 [Halogeometricum borinquense]|uniref:MarR family transcriptional regulator n=1 Tax=Halogeometricum borinquense TaxID=60847 RepID=A0A6C0UQB7_9EURY|nr:hypothetical protein [Halogeometricum borinquense]QIB75148.1 hypothetical protein G3I44_13170 [Halogeometricum borinquense]QIQ75871.1 hypothetical protein GL213_04655 [Halogeometricum borinquense]